MNTTASVVGWAAEPQSRGTVGLIWSCLATIFLFTWNAVHPNVPARDDSAWQIVWRRVGYMLAALLAPEYVLLVALDEWFAARTVQAESPDWSLSQSFFLIMGGFALQEDDKELIYTSNQSMLTMLCNNEISWPNKSLEADILDRSKADWVLKTLALAQATWFIAQIIGRAVQRLPVTTLELFTLGIISCAIPIYVAYWAKPFDVRSPIVVHLRDPLPSNLRTYRRMEFLSAKLDLHRPSHRNLPVLLLLCFTLVLGAIHLIGWQFQFPTELELWFWRVSSVMCALLPLLYVILFFLIDDSGYGLWTSAALIGLYALCRIYMFLEMFISLREVPEGVYRTPLWSQYLPSFG